MATKVEINQHLISPLECLLGEPKRHDVQGFYETIDEVLEPYTVYQLQRAANHFKRSWQPGYWPTPAKMVDACDSFPPEEPVQGDKANYRKFDAARKKQDAPRLSHDRVISLISGPMGLQAASEGWAYALYLHTREQHGLPMPDEADALSRAARKNQKLADDIKRNQFTDPGTDEVKPFQVHDKLLTMTNALLEKERKFAAMIHQNQPRSAA